jgi:4-hydroxy-tetrahydrodipicolinate reductase
MTKIIMLGCNGRMGQMITDMVKQDDECTIVAGIDIVDNRDNGYPVYTKLADCDVEADAIIDFTSATDFESRMDYAVDKQIPIIECSTGLSEEQMDYLKKTSEKVAVLKSANMSLGINLLMKLLKEAAVKLAGDGFDVEIVEKHHNQKLDAPSGTALALADSINEAMDDRYEYIYDRSQVRQKRDKKELGISAVRGGTIVGEHEVIFAGTDEVITFKHTAYSRAVFAKGSITAAKYLKGKAAGLYDMSDVLL